MSEDLGQHIANVTVEMNSRDPDSLDDVTREGYQRALGIARGFLRGARHLTYEGYLLPEYQTGVNNIEANLGIETAEDIEGLLRLATYALVGKDVRTTGVRLHAEGEAMDVGVRQSYLYVPDMRDLVDPKVFERRVLETD